MSQFKKVFFSIGILWGFFVSLALTNASASSTNHILFTAPGVQHPEYNLIVQAIKPGDTLQFSNGKKINVGSYIDSGNTTRIFNLAGDPTQVLRIPKFAGLHPDTKLPYTEYMANFQKGELPLRKNGAPLINTGEFLPAEYSLVEKVDLRYSYYDFVNPDDFGNPRLHEKMKKAFIKFAERLAPFEEVGDFAPDQIYYDLVRDEWRIFDWHASTFAVKFDSEVELARTSTPFWIKEKPARGNVPALEEQAFFGDFLIPLETKDGTKRILWVPHDSDDQWLADLANQSQKAITKKRQELFREHTRGYLPCSKELKPFMTL